MWGVCKQNGDQPLLLQAGISRRVVEANRPALFRLSSTCLTSLQSQSVNGSSKTRCSCGDQLKFTWIRFCKAPKNTQKRWQSIIALFSFHKGPPNFRRRRPPYKMNASWKARQSVRPAGNLARNFVNTSHCWGWWDGEKTNTQRALCGSLLKTKGALFGPLLSSCRHLTKPCDKWFFNGSL